MPETGASGSVGAPLEESGALPGNSNPYRCPSGNRLAEDELDSLLYLDCVRGLLRRCFSPFIEAVSRNRMSGAPEPRSDSAAPAARRAPTRAEEKV
jgi:hypothetical protein